VNRSSGHVSFETVDTTAKDDAIRDWCERITHQTGKQWRYRRVNQSELDGKKLKSFAEAVA
jgi:hypothetical protein